MGEFCEQTNLNCVDQYLANVSAQKILTLINVITLVLTVRRQGSRSSTQYSQSVVPEVLGKCGTLSSYTFHHLSIGNRRGKKNHNSAHCLNRGKKY